MIRWRPALSRPPPISNTSVKTLPNYRLHEFVVMPEHFHLLITVTDLSIERVLQFIKGRILIPCGKGVRVSSAHLAKRIL